VDDLLALVEVVERRKRTHALASAVTSPSMSKNFFGKKCVYASMRMDVTPRTTSFLSTRRRNGGTCWRRPAVGATGALSDRRVLSRLETREHRRWYRLRLHARRIVRIA